MNDTYIEKVSIMEDIGYIAIESRIDPMAISVIDRVRNSIKDIGLFRTVTSDCTSKRCEFALAKLVLERSLEMVNQELSKIEKENLNLVE